MWDKHCLMQFLFHMSFDSVGSSTQTQRRMTDLSQEKTRILDSLASCSDPAIVLEVLDFTLTSEVRNQDVIHGLYGGSVEGRETAWKWLKNNWDYICMTRGSGFITHFVTAVVSPFASCEKAEEVEEFFATRTKPSIARTLRQSIERVHINSTWIESIQAEKHLADVVQELAYRTY